MVERAGEREARLAAALRENLKRRKAQARDGVQQVPPADPAPIRASFVGAGPVAETSPIDKTRHVDGTGPTGKAGPVVDNDQPPGLV